MDGQVIASANVSDNLLSDIVVRIGEFHAKLIDGLDAHVDEDQCPAWNSYNIPKRTFGITDNFGLETNLISIQSAAALSVAVMSADGKSYRPLETRSGERHFIQAEPGGCVRVMFAANAKEVAHG